MFNFCLVRFEHLHFIISKREVEFFSSSSMNIIPGISQRNFLRLDHIVSEGISVFNQPLIANTIYYNDLIFIGDDDKKTGAVNILARRALYA